MGNLYWHGMALNCLLQIEFQASKWYNELSENSEIPSHPNSDSPMPQTLTQLNCSHRGDFARRTASNFAAYGGESILGK